MLRVTAHRIYCPDCGKAHYAQIPFLPSPTARVTRQMERTVLEMRREMCISAVAEYFGLSPDSRSSFLIARAMAALLLRTTHILAATGS